MKKTTETQKGRTVAKERKANLAFCFPRQASEVAVSGVPECVSTDLLLCRGSCSVAGLVTNLLYIWDFKYLELLGHIIVEYKN